MEKNRTPTKRTKWVCGGGDKLKGWQQGAASSPVLATELSARAEKAQ